MFDDGKNEEHFENDQKTEDFGNVNFGGYTDPGEPKPKQQKKKSKWPVVIAMALVFGLIAGSVTYGINYFGNKYIYNTNNVPVRPAAENKELGAELQQVIGDEETSGGTYVQNGTVESVAATCMPSLVTIATISVQEMQSIFGGSQTYQAQGAGSGVIIGRNDTELLIATNNHVISGANSVSVGFIDETTAEAVVKGGDADHDLAVIAVKLDGISQETLENITIATIGDSDSLNIGEQVVAIGNALGYGQSVTSGYVSALNRELTLSDNGYVFTSSDLIQTDAAINGGNSGGALFNMKGELIGINEAKSSSSSGGMIVEAMGYAIPISKALPILQDLMNLSTREKAAEGSSGYMGVECADVTEEAAERYAMPEGVLFTEVIAGSPAEAAGALKGDVLTKIDGRSVSTYSQLQSELQYYSIGQTIDIVVLRNNGDGEYEPVTLTITLGDRSVLGTQQNSSGSQPEEGGQQPEMGQQPETGQQPDAQDFFNMWGW